MKQETGRKAARRGAMWLAVAAMAGTAIAPPAAAEEGGPGAELGELINRALRADGPFFTAPERAVIEQACGYAPGAWDGFQVNINDGVLTCTNGRRADSPQVRAVLAAAEPRIERRVEAVMARPEIVAAIGRVAREAEAEALRELSAHR